MKMIDQPRDTDDLASFGIVLRFAALIYENEDEGEANAPFEPHNIDGDVVFPLDQTSADAAFDAWVEMLKAAEEQFIEEGEEEGFVALLDTPRGLMILAGTNLMGYDGPDVSKLLPGALNSLAMPHIEWERILHETLGEPYA